jgi:hypothetical protein
MRKGEENKILYDAIERAIANLHAALAAVDTAWLGITATRPSPPPTAFAALNAADKLLIVAREDLTRAREALAAYVQEQAED